MNKEQIIETAFETIKESTEWEWKIKVIDMEGGLMV